MERPLLLLQPLLLVALAVGCRGSDTSTAGSSALDAAANDADASTSMGDASANGDAGCTSVVQQHEPTSYNHLLECSVIAYDTNPPSGGDHYPVWAAYQTYSFPVPAGYLVHDMEHGGVVFWYNCPDGCPGEVAEAEAMIDALPDNPVCAGYAKRVTLTPYPELTTRWAASSWGWTLRSDCFDAATFTNFYTQHEGNGLEQECSQGTVIQSGACQ